MIDNYLELFNTDIPQMEAVTEAATARGAGYADLFFENSSKDSISLRDGKVSAIGSSLECGVGVRALSTDKTGYAWCDGTDKARMMQAAKSAALIADSACSGIAQHNAGTVVSSGINGGNFYPGEDEVRGIRFKECADMLTELEDRIRQRDSRINKVFASIRFHDRKIMFFNNLGETACDFQPMRTLVAGITFSDGSRSDSRSLSRSFRSDFSLFNSDFTGKMVDDLIARMERSLEARRPKGGRMPVVMAAGASGILLHEAMGHAFEADFNRKGQSVFAGRMGQRVCPEGINIVDDATVFGNRGSINIDDEGVPGQKTYMVTDGVLSSYLHDRISAAHYGVRPTGNGRREDFRYPPLPRMRLTYMENGNCDRESLIADVRQGIYVDEFSNGEVKIGEGDFTFYVSGGYLIENGRLTTPVKDVNVIGNGPVALSNIRAVGNDLTIDDSCWICGKGQNVPVGCGMPSILVDGLTVGGEQ